MKNILIITGFLCLSITYFGCKKNEDSPKRYTLTGHILNTCKNLSPLVHDTFVLSYVTGSATVDKAVFKIDKNGLFTISYDGVDPANGKLNIYLRFQNQMRATIIEGLKENTDLNLNDVVFDASSYLIFKIKLSGTITTEHDTISYWDGGETQKIAGPFYENQPIDTLALKHYFSTYHDNGVYTFTAAQIWKFNQFDAWTTSGSATVPVCQPYTDMFFDLGQLRK